MEKVIAIVLIVIVVVSYSISYKSISYKYDSTDDKANKKRSGLTLYIDNKTGLHYIKGGIFGSIIPRLDKDGKQVGREVDND